MGNSSFQNKLSEDHQNGSFINRQNKNGSIISLANFKNTKNDGRFMKCNFL